MSDSNILFNIPTPPCSRLLGWRLEDHDTERGWIRIAFDGKEDFLNPAGFIQGGILAAMLDDCMGPAVWIKTGGTLYTASIDMTISFLAPARPGRLIGEGSVLQIGRTVAFLESRLMNETGDLLARATASARLVPAQRAVGGSQDSRS